MKKTLFFQNNFQDTKEGWFLPNEEDSALYVNYIYATQGGIVRLTPEMPNNFHGIGTGWLQKCLGLLILGKEDKASIIHVTPRCNMQPIVEEIKWIGQVKDTIIAYNPKGCTEDYLDNFVKQLNSLFKENQIKPCFKSTNYGSIIFHRHSQEIILPKVSRVGSSEWPLLRENLGLINDFFSQSPELRLEFNGCNFETIPELVLDAQTIFEENETLLTTDTAQNKAQFKNKLYLSALNQKINIVFFNQIRPLLKNNIQQFDKILTDITQAFFDYKRGTMERQKELAKLYFGNEFDLTKLVDELNQQYSSYSK